MLSHATRWILAFALSLTAHASLPGWTPAAIAAPSENKKKCTAKWHRHAKPKVAATKPAARGAGAAQIRRVPDVQILTFGP